MRAAAVPDHGTPLVCAGLTKRFGRRIALRLIVGARRPSAGNAALLGLARLARQARQAHAPLGYLPSDPVFEPRYPRPWWLPVALGQSVRLSRGDAPLSTGVHPTGIIVLSPVSVVLVAAGALALSRRDLRS